MNSFEGSLKIVADWIENYRSNVSKYPVLSKLEPGQLINQLPLAANAKPDDFKNIFNDFNSIIIPGITHWQHPQFFGYFPANSSEPSVLAEMLIAALGVQGMSWITSPAATELEIRMMEWLRDLFGLPTSFRGVIQDSASTSTMTAMLVAREKITNFQINKNGFNNFKLTAYCSNEAHSSVEKAAKIIGIGEDNLRKIPVDKNLSMNCLLLEEAIKKDIKNGLTPFFIMGAFGTTGTTAIDNLNELATLAKKYNLWFHVDAAYAGSALILPELRDLAAGIEKADSIVVNPHKWLLTTFDCSSFFIKDYQSLINTFSILPEYLKTQSDDQVTNFRDWGPGLGRRFRSLKLWFVIRWYGVEGLQQIIRRHIELAKEFEKYIKADSRFELMCERQFNLVCFRLIGSCEQNKKLLNLLNNSGKVFLTHTKVANKITIRFVAGQTDVQLEHIQNCWKLITQIVDGELNLNTSH